MKDAVLITYEDFAKVSAKAIAEFVAEFEKTAGTSDMSTTHMLSDMTMSQMLIGLAVTAKMHQLLFKEDEDEGNSD